MAAGLVDAVVVGADRIAANGDTANKIGTYALACAAAHNRIPFVVVAPRAPSIPRPPTAPRIPIEERDAAEVVRLAGRHTTVPGTRRLQPGVRRDAGRADHGDRHRTGRLAALSLVTSLTRPGAGNGPRDVRESGVVQRAAVLIGVSRTRGLPALKAVTPGVRGVLVDHDDRRRRPMRQLVLVHGRSPQRKDAAALKAEWLDALHSGLAAAGLTLPIPESEVRFPYYGDALDALTDGAIDRFPRSSCARPNAPNVRRSCGPCSSRWLGSAGSVDADVTAEAGPDVAEPGQQDGDWFRALLRLLDRSTLAGTASIALFTDDVYRYLTHVGVRDAIDSTFRRPSRRASRPSSSATRSAPS